MRSFLFNSKAKASLIEPLRPLRDLIQPSHPHTTDSVSFVPQKFTLQSCSVPLSVFLQGEYTCVKLDIFPADLPWNSVLVWDYSVSLNISLTDPQQTGRKRKEEGRCGSLAATDAGVQAVLNQSSVQCRQTLRWRKMNMETKTPSHELRVTSSSFFTEQKSYKQQHFSIY